MTKLIWDRILTPLTSTASASLYWTAGVWAFCQHLSEQKPCLKHDPCVFMYMQCGQCVHGQCGRSVSICVYVHTLFKNTAVTIATQLLTIALSDGSRHRVQLHDDKPLKTAHNLPLTTAKDSPVVSLRPTAPLFCINWI